MTKLKHRLKVLTTKSSYLSINKVNCFAKYKHIYKILQICTNKRCFTRRRKTTQKTKKKCKECQMKQHREFHPPPQQFSYLRIIFMPSHITSRKFPRFKYFSSSLFFYDLDANARLSHLRTWNFFVECSLRGGTKL